MYIQEMNEIDVGFVEKLFGNWWLVLLESIFLIAIGLCALFIPQFTLYWYIMLVGLYRLVMGIFYLIFGIVSYRKKEFNSKVTIVNGIVNIIIGIVFISLTEALIGFLAIIIAFATLIVGGGILLSASNPYMRAQKIVAGLIIFGFGIFFILNMSASVSFVVMLGGIFLIIVGIFMLLFAFHMRKILKDAKMKRLRHVKYNIH
jgi:uncharacterized membrane protein HdeD (DUF308 family)